VLLEVLSRSDAADAEGGRPRANITNIADIKMDWLSGAKNVQIEQPTKHVKSG
jgi:hypothetical protein